MYKNRRLWRLFLLSSTFVCELDSKTLSGLLRVLSGLFWANAVTVCRHDLNQLGMPTRYHRTAKKLLFAISRSRGGSWS